MSPSKRIKSRRSHDIEIIEDHNEERHDVEIIKKNGNILARKLLNLKDWANSNASTVRKSFWSILIIAILSSAFFIIQSIRLSQHKEQYTSLIKQYEDSIVNPDEKSKKKALNNISTLGEKLCNVFLRTTAAKNGCLVSALAQLELKNTQKFASYLESYSNAHGFNDLSIITGFYAGYAYEANGNLNKALQIYLHLNEKLEKTDRQDISKFHTARIYYLQDKLDKAEKLLNSVDKKLKSVFYKSEIKNYKRLIALRKFSKK